MCYVFISTLHALQRIVCVAVAFRDATNCFFILSLKGDTSKLSQVFLQDFSKYGTSVNGVRISGTVHLKNGDEILFGKNNSHYRWAIDYNPFAELCLTKC